MEEQSTSRLIAWALRQLHVPAEVKASVEASAPIPGGGRLVVRGRLLVLQTETPVAALPPALEDLVLVVRERYAQVCAAAEKRSEEGPRLDEEAPGVRAAAKRLCPHDVAEDEQEPTRPRGRGLEAS